MKRRMFYAVNFRCICGRVVQFPVLDAEETRWLKDRHTNFACRVCGTINNGTWEEPTSYEPVYADYPYSEDLG